MKRHEVDALLGLFADDVEEERGVHVRDVALEAADRLVHGHGAERLGARVKHALADRLHVLSHGEVHHEVRAGLERDCELLQFVALAGVRDAAPEVRVDLRGEHPSHAHGLAVRVRRIERNHGRAVRHCGAHGLDVDIFIRRDGFHRVGHKALAGRFQLRHFNILSKGR